MGLKDIFTALDTPLKAAVAGLFPGKTLTHEFGAENETKQSAPPRIVWVPVDDVWGPPQQSNRDAGGNSGKTPRHLWLLAAKVRVRFWAAPEYDDTFALVQAFVQQLYLLPVYGGRTLRPEAGVWDPANAQLDRLGRSYHLLLTFGIPLVEGTPAVAVLPPVAQVAEIDFANPPPSGHPEVV